MKQYPPIDGLATWPENDRNAQEQIVKCLERALVWAGERSESAWQMEEKIEKCLFAVKKIMAECQEKGD